MKPLKKYGRHALPWFCITCHQHSWKNCYGENPCTPVRLLTREFPLDPKSHEAILILQDFFSKVPFEKSQTWSKTIHSKYIPPVNHEVATK
jgi:hypothetical protein